MDQVTCTPPFPFEFLIYSVGTCDTGGSNIARRDYEICVKLKKCAILGEDKKVFNQKGIGSIT